MHVLPSRKKINNSFFKIKSLLDYSKKLISSRENACSSCWFCYDINIRYLHEFGNFGYRLILSKKDLKNFSLSFFLFNGFIVAPTWISGTKSTTRPHNDIKASSFMIILQLSHIYLQSLTQQWLHSIPGHEAVFLSSETYSPR